MVNRLKLNEKTLRDAELRPGVSYQIFDTEVIGFAVRVHASGARTFTIDYPKVAIGSILRIRVTQAIGDYFLGLHPIVVAVQG